MKNMSIRAESAFVIIIFRPKKYCLWMMEALIFKQKNRTVFYVTHGILDSSALEQCFGETNKASCASQ